MGSQETATRSSANAKQQEENSSCISSASKCGRQRTADAAFQAANAYAADAADAANAYAAAYAAVADAQSVDVWRADADDGRADADAWHADVEHADAWHADAEHAEDSWHADAAELQAAAWFAVDFASRWKYSDVVRRRQR